MKRIGYLRISQETNAFSPVLTEVEDFRRTHWFEGDDLARAASSEGIEAPGFARDAELSGFVQAAAGRVEAVPLLSAWAVPGGPLSGRALAELRARVVQAVSAAGPLDGVYVSLHGAMSAVGEVDPEARFLEDVRGVVGPGVPIAASFDLHGQMSRAKLRPLDIATAYRTNPHRDHARVGRRTGDILVRTVLGEVCPTLAWRSLPLVLGGGTTVDFLSPMRAIYRWMSQVERDPRVLYVSLFNCHIWNDHPDLGWSAVVVTDGDEALADRLADELADRAWAVRHLQPPEFPSATEAISLAREAWVRRRLGTVCISDASDAVGAGAPGENTALIRALLVEGGDLIAYAPIRDATAVHTLWESEPGTEVEVTVGGRLHPALNEPLPLRGRVRGKHEGEAFGRRVVVECGRTSVVVTEHAPLATRPGFYREVGLEPWRADVVVVKSLFPFRWYFLAENRLSLYARTEGVTDLSWAVRVERNTPVHPRDVVDDWRPTDQRRRDARPRPLDPLPGLGHRPTG